MLDATWLQTSTSLSNLVIIEMIGSLGVELKGYLKLQNFWVAKALMSSYTICKIGQFQLIVLCQILFFDQKLYQLMLVRQLL